MEDKEETGPAAKWRRGTTLFLVTGKVQEWWWW